MPQNVVQYTGSKADREVIRKHEFYHANGDSRSKKKRYKFDVLLVSLPSLLHATPLLPCICSLLREVACLCVKSIATQGPDGKRISGSHGSAIMPFARVIEWHLKSI